jgi:hypothetical protein
LGYLVHDRWLCQQVIGNRREIVIAQIFEAVGDGLAHRALDLGLLGRGASLQQFY